MRANTYILIFLLLNCKSFAFSEQAADTTIINKIFKQAALIKDTNQTQAENLIRKGYSMAQKVQYEAGIATALYQLGTIYYLKGKNDSALYYLRHAKQIQHRINNGRAEAETDIWISYTYTDLRSKDSSLTYIYHALHFFESIKDSLKIGFVNNELSNFYHLYGDDKRALSYLDKSMRIFFQLGDSSQISSTNKLYGIIYYSIEDYKKALDYFLKALAIDVKGNSETVIARDLNFLGLCYEVLHKDSEALASFRKSYLFFSRAGKLQPKAEVTYNIGIFYFNRNKIDSSIFYYEKSLQLIKAAQLTDMEIDLFSALSEAYAMKGNYEKAYAYQQHYSELNDSLLNTEKVKSIAEMQTKYETEKKEQQITLLDQQNKTRVAQRNFFIAGSVVLLLALFVLAFYYLQRQRLAKKNEQIAQEKISGLLKEQEIKTYNAMIEGQEEERKRIATDLHDRLGSMLSTVKLMFSALNEKIDRNQDENTSQYTKTTNLLDEAVQEVRRVSHNLSTGMVNSFGLVSALEELCESIDKSGMIRCKLLSYGMDERLSQQIEIGLFRMVQELVNNTLKHAKAKQLTIQLNRNENSLNLTVEDDGVGFDVAEKRKKGGIGLKNLEMRAQKLEGTYTVDSRPGHGTISIIEIPLKGND